MDYEKLNINEKINAKSWYRTLCNNEKSIVAMTIYDLPICRYAKEFVSEPSYPD